MTALLPVSAQSKAEVVVACPAMSEASSLEGASWARWIHEVRRIEFEGTIEHVSLGRQATVLELGCADGFQRGALLEA